MTPRHGNAVTGQSSHPGPALRSGGGSKQKCNFAVRQFRFPDCYITRMREPGHPPHRKAGARIPRDDSKAFRPATVKPQAARNATVDLTRGRGSLPTALWRPQPCGYSPRGSPCPQDRWPYSQPCSQPARSPGKVGESQTRQAYLCPTCVSEASCPRNHSQVHPRATSASGWLSLAG